MRHTHYIVQAFDSENAQMQLEGLVTVELTAEDEGAAISKAQKLAGGRNWYRVIQVVEHDPEVEITSQFSEPILQQLKDGELTLDRIQILEQTGEIRILPDLANLGNHNGKH
jgi:hypothetical protein|tara:strand:+ start:93 stop:428 length:336 start_codon:yes stop_codon:yes gene_type:complete